MGCLWWRAGGIWQQMLWWAGCVHVGDLVHRECFRGVSWSSSLAVLESSFGSVLECADWFLLRGPNGAPGAHQELPGVLGWRATQDPKQKPEHLSFLMLWLFSTLASNLDVSEKRKGKGGVSVRFSSTAKHNSSNFACWIFKASKEVLHHHQEC